MNDCTYCKIVNRELPATVAYESDAVIAFGDINPIAPVHILIIPKEHIQSINYLEERHGNVVAEMFFAAKEIAKKEGIADDGYKLLIRTGTHGQQEIPHIHLHLIGGAQLSEDIHPV